MAIFGPQLPFALPSFAAQHRPRPAATTKAGLAHALDFGAVARYRLMARRFPILFLCESMHSRG
jgi:hypothetical protein